MKLPIDIFLLCLLGLSGLSLCSSQNESVNEAKNVYNQLIELNESFTKKIVNVKERKEAQIIIDRFVAEQDKLLTKVNEIENKYPDFRQDPALKEFENTLERKTRQAVYSGIDSLQKIAPVKSVKELADVMNDNLSKYFTKQKTETNSNGTINN